MEGKNIFSDTILTFLAPIKHLIENPDISEIMINGPKQIYIEKKGHLELTDVKFSSEDALLAAVRNIAQYVGRKIDDEHPRLDARLPDGSRIHAVIPPCARNGTTVSIRKFSKSKLTLKDLIKFKSLTVEAAKFIDVCLYLKKNIIVSGGTGSGKTTLLNILASRIDKNIRIIVIEDSSEIQISKDHHVVYFETKPPNKQGKGEVTIKDLIKSSLRLRPDRIIVGEVRGGEALDLISAMNTGHGGSMGTIHANNPAETLTRLETLAMSSGDNLPLLAIKLQIASAIDIIIQASRLRDGSRKIVNIAQVLDLDDNGRYIVKDVFKFNQEGLTPEGKVIGRLEPTGFIPTFWPEVKANNLDVDESIFEK